MEGRKVEGTVEFMDGLIDGRQIRVEDGFAKDFNLVIAKAIEALAFLMHFALYHCLFLNL